ncbi:MAG: NADH-quinone oxidoreductase subunit N [Cytophagaceae bacterium]|nr:NADH-quinone oxidoreductase subunit N [Cytophagaceae bacterium]MDW8455582.1 NADH-quinone oxidoreductase subunit N [Cytophagaceae bacterium]
MGTLVIGHYECFFQLLVLCSLILTLVFSFISDTFSSVRKTTEFYIFLITLSLSLFFLISSSDLVVTFISLETVSLCSYMLSIMHFNRSGTEAAIKYLLFGAFASGVMLYGFSLLYGVTHHLNFTSTIFTIQLSQVENLVIIVGFVLSIAGFLFKISAFPFHFWLPDLYSGAPINVLSFFSTAPKLSAMWVLSKYVGPFLFHTNLQTSVLMVLVFMSASSMLMGNLSALRQISFRRLLAYSSIAHAGFMAITLSITHPSARPALMFYSLSYIPVIFSAFILCELMSRKTGSDLVNNFKGLGLKNPVFGVIFVITMVSLTGLPPTAGFYAKFFILSATWKMYISSHHYAYMILFSLGILTTILSLFYYLKIPYYLFFHQEENNTPLHIKTSEILLPAILVTTSIILFIKPDWLINVFYNTKL